MNEETCKDALNLLCGEKIGSGIHRQVFKCKIRPDLVVKVEDSDFRYFANVLECMFWNDHEYYTSVSKWLAPCLFLSPDGRILLQKRADPLPSDFKLPKKLPEFLTDVKRENFGLIDGKLVCIDYAMNIPNPSLKLKAVNW